MAGPQPIDATIVLGSPGPSGAGVSSSQLASIQGVTNHIFSGTGSPEGVVTGAIGDLYRRTDGAAGTSLYAKESGSGNTGWRAVGTFVYSGTGSPEGVVTASTGDLYQRTDGPIGQTLYAKGGGTSTRGWVPFDGSVRYGAESHAQATPNGTSILVSGMGAWTNNTGTITNDDHSSSAYIDYATTAVASNSAGPNGPAEYKRDWNADVTFKILTPSDITLINIWAALADADPTGLVSPNSNMAGFRFDAGNGDVTWRCRTADGTSGVATDSTQTVTASTAFRLRILMATSSVRFYINNVFVVERTANLPTASAYLRPYVRVMTQAAAVKHVGFAYFHGWHE